MCRFACRASATSWPACEAPAVQMQTTRTLPLINTDRVAVCGGHGRLQTKRDYVLNIHEPYSQNERGARVRCARWGEPEFREFLFEICGMVAKCRNSGEICPSACEICLASAIFMPHIHSPFARFVTGPSRNSRDRPDPRSSATHCPFDCCPPMMPASSLPIQSMRSDALSLCGDCGVLRQCVCCVV